MRFSSLSLVLILIWSGSLAEDKAIDEILQKSKDIINSSDELAGEAARDLSSVEPIEEADPSWLMPDNRGASGAESNDTSSAQQRAWNSILGSVEEGVTVKDDGPPHPAVPEDVIYVYFSLSMPKDTIRNLFLQALHEDELEHTIFVLRGWKPPRIGDLVSRLNDLFPDAQKLRDLPNVQINPTLFEQQSVDRVPTYSTKDGNGRWGKVVGTTSIADAVSRINEGRYLDQVIGPTYTIEEPNILKVIQERIATVDWNAEVERVKDSMLTKSTSGRELPYATDDDSYLVDLTIQNNRDISGPDGEVFVYSGATVNPFDYMTVRRRYVFIDANVDSHVEQAKAWRRENEMITVVTTIPIRSVAKRREVIAYLGQPVHEINDLLINRFKLKAVPSIAYQEDRMLRVDVVAAKQGLDDE